MRTQKKQDLVVCLVSFTEQVQRKKLHPSKNARASCALFFGPNRTEPHVLKKWPVHSLKGGNVKKQVLVMCGNNGTINRHRSTWNNHMFFMQLPSNKS